MKLLRRVVMILLLFSFLPCNASFAKEITMFSFENGPQGWSIPDWALSKEDYVAKEIRISEHYSTEGDRSFDLKVDFPGGEKWRGAYAECPMGVTDWTPFSWLLVDVLLPEDAPRGLRARIVLTVSDEWKWTESNKSIRLIPGEWTLIKVNLLSGSLDWRRFIGDEFRSDVKKIGVRIESNGTAYKGSVFIDNITLSDE